MGLSEQQILTRVELPLASPVMVGGFRIALLQVIATATIGAFLAGGGFGRFIIDGIARRDDGMLYAGVLFVAVLAIGTDTLLSLLQRRLTPKGVRIARGEMTEVVTSDAAAT
jgi:osmoprotectant transport system permease protein